MTERFLKLNNEDEKNHPGDWLAIKYPHAFILLYFIARRARRYNGHPDGLIAGDALIGSTDFEPGMSRQNFRTALEKLVELGYVKIVSNGKKLFVDRKSTIKVTITGMLVNLCDVSIWDINSEDGNQHINQRLTNGQPTANHKQEGIRKKKNEKESHPSIPSFENREPKRDDGRTMDDFSSQKEIEIIPGVFISQADLDSCVKLKGSIEKVREAVEYIQSSKKRKHPISDWPNALTRWKIENKAEVTAEGRLVYAETLCKEFPESQHKLPWRCRLYNDKKKDQRGILFEPSSAYKEPFFVALMDGQFQAKCEEFIAGKNMRKK